MPHRAPFVILLLLFHLLSVDAFECTTCSGCEQQCIDFCNGTSVASYDCYFGGEFYNNTYQYFITTYCICDTSSNPTQVYVATNGADSTTCGPETSPCATISYAAIQCENSNTCEIKLQPGAYEFGGQSFSMQNITITPVIPYSVLLIPNGMTFYLYESGLLINNLNISSGYSTPYQTAFTIQNSWFNMTNINSQMLSALVTANSSTIYITNSTLAGPIVQCQADCNINLSNLQVIGAYGVTPIISITNSDVLIANCLFDQVVVGDESSEA